MQSYSHQKQHLTADDLPNLVKQLKLPKGWKYKTGIIRKNQHLRTINNVAYVLQDEFLNSYRRAEHDFLP